MNRKSFKTGLIITVVSFIIMGFPFSPHVASISETYYDCQKGTGDMRAAILMARGSCEPAKITYLGLLLGILIGIIMMIVWFVRFVIRVLKLLSKLEKKG